MTNLEYYKEEIKRWESFLKVYIDCTGKEIDYGEIIDWLLEEYRKPLLTEDDKKYLRQLEKTLDIEIEKVCKQDDTRNTEHIAITYNTKIEREHLSLPAYERKKKFSKLDYGKEYTMEELGL